jgi:hypothetical protein
MNKAEKEYKISYKIYYNERLKKSYFHNKLIHPLYIQVIFDRIPIIFKSYYFELFSKPRYAIHVSGKIFAPDIKQIISKEKAVIDFIINKNQQSFSLDIFKKEYNFYSRDLLDTLERDFSNYLYTFFHDAGLPFLAEIFRQEAPVSDPYKLIQDMKKALDPGFYKKLIDNSFYYAPPYLSLYSFAERFKANRLISLTVMEWLQPKTQEAFIRFFKKEYPHHIISETFKKIQQWLTGD